MRFWKKKNRRFQAKEKRKVRYGCRQNLANQRFRFQGRFIKRDEMDKLNPESVFDPSRMNVKQKNIFKISKEPKLDWPCDASENESDSAMQSNNLLEESNYHEGDLIDDTAKEALNGQLLRLTREYEGASLLGQERSLIKNTYCEEGDDDVPMIEPAMCAAIGHEFATPENNIAPGLVLRGIT